MTSELLTEANRLSRDLQIALWHSPASAEVPLRIHGKGIDHGGLGAPEFHPAFLRYLGDSTVCSCGRVAVCAPECRWEKDHVLGHLDACQPACKDDGRFHPSRHTNSPNRMRRALRQVRKLNPKAYDLVFLMVARQYTFSDACAKINESHVQRGQPEKSAAEFAVLWVSGASMLSAGW